jgi:hypothetical protein
VAAADDRELELWLRAWRRDVLPRRFPRLKAPPAPAWNPAAVPLGPAYWHTLRVALWDPAWVGSHPG